MADITRETRKYGNLQLIIRVRAITGSIKEEAAPSRHGMTYGNETAGVIYLPKIESGENTVG